MHTFFGLDDSGVIGGSWPTHDSFSTPFGRRRWDGLRGSEPGVVRGRTAGKKGGLLLGRMVSCESVCLRRLAGGQRRGIVAYWRFLANPQVTAESLIAGWGAQTS